MQIFVYTVLVVLIYELVGKITESAFISISDFLQTMFLANKMISECTKFLCLSLFQLSKWLLSVVSKRLGPVLNNLATL